MDRKYSGEQILDALSEVGIGAGDISEVMGYLGRMSLAELNNKSTKLNRENDELISRQAVLSLAKDVILANGCKHRCIDATQIHELPSAEPKTGKWIDTEFMKLKECSICHARWGIYSIEEFDFCPNCGAKMGGGR